MLYESLRVVTQPLHDASMQHPFMSRLMNGGMDQNAFFDYLTQLRPVYETLEANIPHSGLPFYDRRLDRLHIIEDSLELAGTHLDVLPETIKYVNRIKTAAQDETLFIAHHYTRYMGDLAAGPMFNFISENLGVSTDYLNFYNFSTIGDPGAIFEYRKTYGEWLNQFIKEEDYERFIDEVVWIFNTTAEIVSALSEQWPPTE